MNTLRTLKIFLVTCLLIGYFSTNAQVNLQTGSATFSLPMFNWDDNKSHMTAVVALAYNSGNGLKVSDVASNVGQGWNLVAGGCISRLQMGEPDDQKSYGSGESVNQYPNGLIYATIPLDFGCPKALTKYPIYNPMNHIYAQHNDVAEDKLVDYFTFQFNGKSGMFVLDTKSGKGDIGAMIGDSRIKITFSRDETMISQGIRTTITSFTITDVDGIMYTFAQHGLTKLLKAEYCDANQIQALTQPKFDGDNVYHQAVFDNEVTNPYVIGSWYLSKIEDPFTNRQVIYNYTNENINAPAGVDISYNQEGNYSMLSHKTSISTTPVLSSITFPDSHSVLFNYGNNREDLNGDKVLSSVDIKYQSRFLSEYQFNTSYFILNRYGKPFSSFEKSAARLCLKSVRKIGVDLKEDSPPYIFDYYMGSSAGDDFVPPAFSFAKDIWGYYNGNNSVPFDNSIPINALSNISQLSNNQVKGLCFLHQDVSGVYLNAKSGYAKNGLLKQIIYPTGGTLSYEYAQNTGKIEGVSQTVGGVHVSSTSSTDGGYSNDCSHPIITNYSYVLADGSSSLWGLEMPINTTFSSSHWEPEKRGWHMGWSAITGTCYWEFQYPGILSKTESVDLTRFQEVMNAMAPVLGILSIVSTVLDVVNLCLDATPLAWVAVALDIIGGIVTYIFACHKNTKDNTATLFYDADLNSVSPLPTQFKRVEVIENPGTRGKTVQEFTSDDDYEIWQITDPINPVHPLFTPKQRFAPWAYGLLKKNTAYDANGNKVHETENIYDFTFAHGMLDWCKQCFHESGVVGCKCRVNYTTSQRNNPDWESSTSYTYSNPDNYQDASSTNMDVEFYNLYTGRVLLTTSYDRTYKSNSSSSYVENRTDYQYNNLDGGQNYDVREVDTKLSNGDIHYKYFNYNSDYASGFLANLMTYYNIYSLPVRTREAISKGGGTQQNISDQVIEYTQSNGDLRPLRRLERRYSQPSSITDSYTGPEGGIGNFTVTMTNSYDNFGNLIGVRDEGGRTVTNIEGYNGKYVVGSIINADPSTDRCSYTSFETAGDFGGWTWPLLATPVYNNTNYVTGNSSLALSTGQTLKRIVNTSKKYILSVWASAPITVAAGSVMLAKTGPTIKGLTYYEYSVQPSINGSVLISGNVVIDELRLYPQNARMRTVTYDPLIGKTSDCDENNRITYYEYDNLGRLRFEKDENGNILKMLEYNNVSAAKQNGCPGIYYNKAITETFVKSNCGSGYAGMDISYTIPANKYSSPLGQWHADILAEQELLVYGQVNADNTSATTGCAFIWYNDLKSQTFTTNDEACGPGYKGGSVTYSVPANKYFSLVSKNVANQLALNEIAANGQAYANDSIHKVCEVNTTAEWRWYEGDNAYCLSVNGQLPAHRFGYALDINPNSSTYNQRQWFDMGVQDECPANTYFSAAIDQDFYSQNCGSNSAMPYYVSVPPGQFSSTVSQADADNQAIAYAQVQADQYGGCTTPVSIPLYYNFYGADYYTVELHNTDTNDYYYFEIQYSGDGISLGYILPGTYDVHFLGNFYDPNHYDHLYIAGASSAWGGSEAYLYGVTLDDSGYNNVLEIY
jgi:hypothetical protein